MTRTSVSPALATFVVIITIVLLCVAYLTAYYSMLDPGDFDIGEVLPGTGRWELLPVYRIDNAIVSGIFWPAHQLDRRAFPDRWSAELDIQVE
jgi:hypothetical protein